MFDNMANFHTRRRVLVATTSAFTIGGAGCTTNPNEGSTATLPGEGQNNELPTDTSGQQTAPSDGGDGQATETDTPPEDLPGTPVNPDELPQNQYPEVWNELDEYLPS
jgi:hypothetical protein